VVGPFLEGLPFARTILSLILTLVLVSAIGALNPKNRTVPVASGLLVVVLIFTWLQTLRVPLIKLDLTGIVSALFYLVLVYSFAMHLFRVKAVTTNVICAALCLYLFIGLLWGALFSVLESIAPGSYSGALLEEATSPSEVKRHLEYYSFVTLSTLGYGDITPQTRGASALCQAEAIIGQFLAMVVVARLVGIQVAQQSREDS
jgi:hypothetical protein